MRHSAMREGLLADKNSPVRLAALALEQAARRDRRRQQREQAVETAPSQSADGG